MFTHKKEAQTPEAPCGGTPAMDRKLYSGDPVGERLQEIRGHGMKLRWMPHHGSGMRHQTQRCHCGMWLLATALLMPSTVLMLHHM